MDIFNAAFSLPLVQQKGGKERASWSSLVFSNELQEAHPCLPPFVGRRHAYDSLGEQQPCQLDNDGYTYRQVSVEFRRVAHNLGFYIWLGNNEWDRT